MTIDPAIPKKVLKISKEGIVRKSLKVPAERPFTIQVNSRELVSLLCLGHHLEELAVGFLRSEGILTTPRQLKKITVDPAKGLAQVITTADVDLETRLYGRRLISSGCGRGSIYYQALDPLSTKKISSPLKVSPSDLSRLVREFNLNTPLYRQVGGIHGVALVKNLDLEVIREDIGRHNAVDMISGHLFLNNQAGESCFLLTTGRISSEILIKAAVMGIPIIASLSAATSLAIELAESLGITLIGYVRRESMIVYTGQNRVSGVQEAKGES